MKRTVFFGAFLLALAIAALAAAPYSYGGKIVPRDVKGVMDGRFVFEGPTEGPWITVGDVTGPLSHFGLSEMYTSHTPNGDGTLTGGVFKIVAANGDEISGNYEGSAQWVASDQVHGNAQFIISGGTGRFEGATGTINASFVETFDDPTWSGAKVSWALVGTVNY